MTSANINPCLSERDQSLWKVDSFYFQLQPCLVITIRAYMIGAGRDYLLFLHLSRHTFGLDHYFHQPWWIDFGLRGYSQHDVQLTEKLICQKITFIVCILWFSSLRNLLCCFLWWREIKQCRKIALCNYDNKMSPNCLKKTSLNFLFDKLPFPFCLQWGHLHGLGLMYSCSDPSKLVWDGCIWTLSSTCSFAKVKCFLRGLGDIFSVEKIWKNST